MAKTDIKFSQIKKKAKEINETEVFEFETGETLTFHPVFPPQMIEKMLEEMASMMKSKPEELELNENMTHKYVLFMCIKHFTHLKNQLKASTLIGQLNEIESLVDSGYFEQIIEEVFLPQEIQKVFDQLSKFGSNYLFLEKMNQKMINEVANLELKNKELLAGFNARANNKVIQ
ncbi:hypothetical protein [Bacillus sp. AG4(2022)]|uniref:hypothetical protein n=1 Tax=Bacillus sp. AG4(2022) TaxID=2962594 RepID=UPI0028825A90|nr:hypothetical protein [Bacillus sp. AG4(2022)]MDT0160270.1 hypothetical protein [Bacillus sp. AG4(2022)]